MAQANNGINANDKVENKMDKVSVPTKYDNINADLYYVISDATKNGVRYLTEGFMVEGIGVVQRDTVFSSQSVTTNTNLIPGVRIVSREEGGCEYIGINATTINESGVGIRR